jgi:hypothetical protein
MSYEQKYLKYKNKYLELKELQIQKGGFCITDECKLIEIGLPKDSAKRFAKLLDSKKVNNAIELIKAGGDETFTLEGVRYLSGNKDEGQIKIMIDLLKARFATEEAYTSAIKFKGDINSGQIKNLIDLKNAGFKNSDAIYYAESLTGDSNTGQIKKMIDFKKAGYPDGISHILAQKTDDQIKKFIDLKKDGYSDKIASNGIDLTADQLKNYLLFIKKNINEYFAYLAAKYFTGNSEKIDRFIILCEGNFSKTHSDAYYYVLNGK